MKTDRQNKNVLFAPRSTGIFLIQYFALVPIITALLITFAAVTSPAHPYSDYAILIGGFIIPPLLAGFLMLYLPQQYRIRIVFNGDTKMLQKIKKGTEPQQFDLTDAKMIIAKVIKTIPGCKFSLTIEDNSESSTPICKEDTNPTFGAKRWLAFAAKLSEMTGLPLIKECYYEQTDGSLLATSCDQLTANVRYGLRLISVPLIISFIGALIYTIFGTQKILFLAGVSTVAINMILSFIYAFLNREKALPNRYIMGDMSESKIILISYIFTLIIPYSLYYLFCISLLSGFRWPFY